MYARRQGTWRHGYLDAHCPPDAWRIEVMGWMHSEGRDTWAGPARTWRTTAQYIKRVGIKDTARKILSRRDAPLMVHRAVGFGRVLCAPEHATLGQGTLVGFASMVTSEGQSHVVAHAPWIVPLHDLPKDVEEGHLCWLELQAPPKVTSGLHHAESGHPQRCDPDALRAAIMSAPWGQSTCIEVLPHAPHDARGPWGTGRVVLMGYGHYAKTCIAPHLKALGLRAIHDIDPMRLPHPLPSSTHRWSTSPELGHGSLRGAIDAAWIAGFHHHHGRLAYEALRRGGWAVIEKPAVTTADDLERLCTHMKLNPRVLMGFHKRHSLLHTWMTEDLAISPHQPAHYHCIVHEVPLPEDHWYTWPSSCSRLVSNGCHWLDEFLWINPNQDVLEAHVHQAQGVLQVWVTLEHGATFTMTLSEHGSSRLGVRELVEVRAAGRTARLWDGARIQTEDGTRVLRDAQVNPMDAYPRMVHALSDIIQRDAVDEAEPLAHFSRLNALVLRLDAMLHPHTTG